MSFVYNKKITVEIPVKFVQITIPVRSYPVGEDMPKDAPLRVLDTWGAVIDLESKKVADWPIGKTLEFYSKAFDSGIYCLLDAEGKEIAKIEGYVPNKFLPGNYGDYLDLNIDENGIVTNWLENASIEEFMKNEDEEE